MPSARLCSTILAKITFFLLIPVQNVHSNEIASRQMAKPCWEAQELALRSTDNSGLASAAEIVAPGKYQVMVKNGDELMAAFAHEADGAVPFTGRRDRENANPLEYLEGARDRFYISRR